MIQPVELILSSLGRLGPSWRSWRRKVWTERERERGEADHNSTLSLYQTLLVSKTMLVLSSPTGILAASTHWVTPHSTATTFAYLP